MEGSSRGALREARTGLATSLEAGAERDVLAEELFAVVRLLDENGSLRRALADPSRDAEPKVELAKRLLGEQVSAATGFVVGSAVAQRWHRDRDLTDALEALGIEALLRQAADQGVIGAVEDELFRFGRIVAGDAELRSAFMDRGADPEAKARLVDSLVAGKVQPVTAQLLRRAAGVARGRRFDHAVEEQLAIAARMQEQLTAVVTVARPLEPAQRERLAAALRRQYDKAVQINVVVDPQVLGGIKVKVGDEVIDGTVSTRLDDARRRLTAD